MRMQVSNPSREFTPLQPNAHALEYTLAYGFKPLAGIHSSATRDHPQQRTTNPSLVSNPSREFTPLQPVTSTRTIGYPPPGFKPLAGIHSSATRECTQEVTRVLPVSNPSREFTPLQHAQRDHPQQRTTKFQTPRGNSLLCNLRGPGRPRKSAAGFKPLAGIHSSATRSCGTRPAIAGRFQTPRGNSLLCNPLQVTWVLTHPYRFQTPRGNSLLCNPSQKGGVEPRAESFKPLAGIHSSATNVTNSVTIAADQVSNPSREFTPLQPAGTASTQESDNGFQTPRGNSLLCNSLISNHCSFVKFSFKPLAGIHSSATSPTTSPTLPPPAVSNPSREFTPLQLGHSACCMRRVWIRFKPLAGIHSSATLSLIYCHLTMTTKFQTPRGNSLLCNPTHRRRSRTRHQVSNPSREFTPLQLCRFFDQRMQDAKFQTPRGNSLLCNRLPSIRRWITPSSFKPLAGIHSSATWTFNSRPVNGLNVSNPSREFTPLQPWLSPTQSHASGWFQTPRGNSLLCNFGLAVALLVVQHVSNPSREFTPLQLSWCSRRRSSRACNVSNPSREFTPLQLANTCIFYHPQVPSFKPLAGIHSSATSMYLLLPQPQILVSNPSREFTPLQLKMKKSRIAAVVVFQTPRGNSLLCNPEGAVNVLVEYESFKPLAGIHSSATAGRFCRRWHP